MCDLVAALTLMISRVATNCATTASEIGRQPLHSNGQTYQNPLLLRVYDRQGELQATWLGQRFGFLQWSTGPELVYLGTTEWSTRLLAAGDPTDGRLYRVHANVGVFRGFANPYEPIFGHYDGSVQERQIRLPAPVHQPLWQLSTTESEHGLQVRGNEVWFDDRVLLPDRGLPHSLYESPSGRWVLAVEDQVAWAPIIYAIEPDGSGLVQAVRAVEPSELPLIGQQPSRTSPDGQWTVTFRSWPWGMLLTHRDGEQRLYHGNPLDGPWWAPDSRRFAVASDQSVWVVDLTDLSLETMQPGVFERGRVLLSPIPGIILGWTPEGIAWLTMGSADHNDYGPLPNKWRETFE